MESSITKSCDGIVTESSYSSTCPDEDASSSPPQQIGRRLQPNLTRRSHKKSRTGCFSCKTRKIKCGEEQPQCHHCIIKSNTCVYPSPEPRKDYGTIRRSRDVSPVESPTGESFSMQDMQFFHHFLTVAYPHLPYGNETVWVKNIPHIAQSHSYLMHAMLGLGASHLDRHTSAEGLYEIAALAHRTYAMSGLNSVLSKNTLEYGEADAILATCFVLTFQSVYLSGGMTDFFTLIRGCSLVSTRIKTTGVQTVFKLTTEFGAADVSLNPSRSLMINSLHIRGGMEGLKTMQPHLSSASEQTFSRMLYSILVALQVSVSEAYRRQMRLYSMWSSLPQEELDRLLDGDNTSAQLLFAYFIAIEIVMVPITKQEWPKRVGDTPLQALLCIMSWAKNIAKKVPLILQQYLEWPASIIRTAEAEILGRPYIGPGVLLLTSR